MEDQFPPETLAQRYEVMEYYIALILQSETTEVFLQEMDAMHIETLNQGINELIQLEQHQVSEPQYEETA